MSRIRLAEVLDELPLVHRTGTLADISRKKPVLKNRVDPAIEQAVVELAFEEPAFGQVRVSNELRKRNLFVSPGGVRSV